MSNDRLHRVCQVVLDIQALGRKYLAPHDSPLAHHVLLFIAYEQSLKRETTVKTLFVSLPYSQTGLRRHLRRLLQLGWIKSVAAEKDRRVKYIRLTRTGMESVQAYTDAVHQQLKKLGYRH